MQGRLKDMGVADLIQHYCQDYKTAHLHIEQGTHQADLYFTDGRVAHAAMGDFTGEEVVYQTLTWTEGTFAIAMDVPPPANTIERSWSGLLLEGARLLDEGELPTLDDLFSEDIQEDKPMATKKKSEQLADALEQLLQESSDIDGAAIVGVDGLVYSANVPQKALDESMVGASSAAVLGLSKRSGKQLKRGAFKQTLIQCEEGNVIVAGINDETLFVGLTPKNVNLGMAFAEVRSMVGEISDIL